MLRLPIAARARAQKRVAGTQPPSCVRMANRVPAGAAEPEPSASPGGGCGASARPRASRQAPRRRVDRPPGAPPHRHHMRLLRGGRRSRQRRPEAAPAPPRRPRGRRGCHRVAVVTGLARRCNNITHVRSGLHRLGLMDHPARPGGKARRGAQAAGAAAPLPPTRFVGGCVATADACVGAARRVPTGRCAAARG
jgi:hypothetical protein